MTERCEEARHADTWGKVWLIGVLCGFIMGVATMLAVWR